MAAATEVGAVFLKDGKEGPTGKEGKAGTNGTNGEKGVSGPAGVAGEKGANGANGAVGAQGPAGPAGPAGPPGKVELVTCEKIKGKQHCTTKLVSGTVKFTATGSLARATLSRDGAVYAAGSARVARGRMSLRLLLLRRLTAGRYTLTLISGAGSHESIRSESFTLDGATRRR